MGATLRIVMMGTGDFALPAFRALLDSPHAVVGLFTQPDRTGAGHHRHRNPLKELACERGVPVLQPPNVNRPESIEALALLAPDVCLVAAYGQILSADLLRVPRLGAVNIHASLLPKYRGAAPIQTAILKGETESGVTLFRIEPKLDAGPILAMDKTPIGPRETAGQLEERLAALGASLVLPTLDQLAGGTAAALAQDSSQASRAPRLKKESGLIDWNRTPQHIDWHVRAMQPWPLAHTTLVRPPSDRHPDGQRQRIIVLEVAVVPHSASQPGNSASPGTVPGTVLSADPGSFQVQTGTGPVEVLSLRPEGKRTMSAAEFLRGKPVEPGDRFESAPRGDRPA